MLSAVDLYLFGAIGIVFGGVIAFVLKAIPLKILFWSVFYVYILPLLFPLVIELLQFIIGFAIGYNYRSVDIDDFILNALGGYLGILFSKLFFKNYGDKIYNILFSR